MRTVRVCSTVVFAALASCNRGAKTGTAPETPAPPLVGYAAQRLVVTPTIRVTFSETDSLVRELGTASAVGRYLDGELLQRLRERGLGANWILPADLVRAYERNRRYAADPYQLVIEPLRSPRFIAGSKYAEPLSSQLRTMIALHDDARLVLLPMSLRLQSGRAVLRVALLDPRFAEARWVGEIRSDSAAAPSRSSLTQVSRRLADLFVAP
ncbi:MAG: hypothetical protein WD825_07685 [Gemmatimonadaceae bacterium]